MKDYLDFKLEHAFDIEVRVSMIFIQRTAADSSFNEIGGSGPVHR
jgi:hypothetical protein